LNRIKLTVSKALPTLIVGGTVRNIYQERVRLIGKNISGSIASMVIDIDNYYPIGMTGSKLNLVIPPVECCESGIREVTEAHCQIAFSVVAWRPYQPKSSISIRRLQKDINRIVGCADSEPGGIQGSGSNISFFTKIRYKWIQSLNGTSLGSNDALRKVSKILRIVPTLKFFQVRHSGRTDQAYRVKCLSISIDDRPQNCQERFWKSSTMQHSRCLKAADSLPGIIVLNGCIKPVTRPKVAITGRVRIKASLICDYRKGHRAPYGKRINAKRYRSKEYNL
jgi:hypothetical protein